MIDVCVVGGGIVGLASALALSRRGYKKILLLEAEAEVASHQTGHNSGVIHSGLYYTPGSLKARTCTDGRLRLLRFCEENEVPHETCGKVVVATSEEELARLGELERRGQANGLAGVKRIGREALRELEPHVEGIAALHVPETGIVDYAVVARAMAKSLEARGVAVHLRSPAVGVRRTAVGFEIDTTRGLVHARFVVTCAGLQSDRVARLFGANPKVRIVPFRGEYYELVPERRSLVKNLVYPVPDPAFPFLGVHFTRMVGGGVEAGPNAVLALARHGYEKTSFHAEDALDTLGYSGFHALAKRFWRTGLGEVHRSFSKGAFVTALRRLVPEISAKDLVPAAAGVRAQALTPEGKLVDDFFIEEGWHAMHVLNAPSPAATASLAIGEQLADRADVAFR